MSAPETTFSLADAGGGAAPDPMTVISGRTTGCASTDADINVPNKNPGSLRQRHKSANIILREIRTLTELQLAQAPSHDGSSVFLQSYRLEPFSPLAGFFTNLPREFFRRIRDGGRPK
jgi:hypothetical protein